MDEKMSRLGGANYRPVGKAAIIYQFIRSQIPAQPLFAVHADLPEGSEILPSSAVLERA